MKLLFFTTLVCFAPLIVLAEQPDATTQASPEYSEETDKYESLGSIVEQLKGIRCPSTIRQKGLKVMSCPDAIGRLIEKVARLQSGRDEEIASELSVMDDLKIPRPMAKCADECVTCTMEDICMNPNRYSPEEKIAASVACPECGKPLEHEGGCVICGNCGYSKCG